MQGKPNNLPRSHLQILTRGLWYSIMSANDQQKLFERRRVALDGRSLTAKLSRAVEMREEDNTTIISVAVSSDMPVEMTDYWGSYNEVLSHQEGDIDLSWMATGDAPTHYYSHSATMTMGSRGHCGNVANPRLKQRDDGVWQLWVDLKFYNGDPVGDEAVARIKSGQLRNVSIGYHIKEGEDSVRVMTDMNGNETIIYKAWQPDEVTLCSLPVDKKGSGIGRQDGSQSPRYYEIPRSDNQSHRSKQMSGETKDKATEGRGEIAELVRSVIREEFKARADSSESGSGERSQKPAEGERSDDKGADKGRAESKSASKPADNGREDFAVSRFLETMKRAGVSEEQRTAFMDESRSFRTASEARARVLEIMEGMESPNPIEGRSAAVHTKKHEYSIGRAIQQAYEGRGLDGLEGEMHAERARTGGPDGAKRHTRANEIIVPLVGDNSFCRTEQFIAHSNELRRAEAARRGRTIQAGSNAQAGILTPAFQERELITALSPEGTLLPLCSSFGFILNQDLKLPVETGRNRPQWVSETATRRDAVASTSNNPPHADSSAVTSSPQAPSHPRLYHD